MVRLLAAAMAGWMAFSSLAQAETDPVVVELFTSQGCSSCPPADELLRKLGEYDDIIPLALHIDYWDYIGWEDKFAQAKFTKRQKSYARAMHQKMIYTPQMIISGRKSVVGNRPVDVADTIQSLRSMKNPVDLDLQRQGNTLSIAMSAKSAVGATDVFVVRYTGKKMVNIKRGENAGLSATYTNIVTDWTKVSKWDGSGALSVKAKVTGDSPIVVLVQSADSGPILAAARLR